MAGIKALFFVLRLGAKTFIPIMCDLRGRPAPEWFQSLQRVPVVARWGGWDRENSRLDSSLRMIKVGVS